MIEFTKEELQHDLDQNLTVKEIAAKYECGEMTVYRRINKYGIKKEEPLYKNKKWLENELLSKDITTISLEQNVDIHTISRWMKKLNIEKSKPLYQNKKWLTEQTYIYDTIKELCDAYNFVEYTVATWCRKYNIAFNNGTIKNYNEHYFKTIDTEHKAYYLGLLMADGFVDKELYNLGIGLKDEDKYMVESFVNEIGYKTELEFKISGYGKEAWYATICSKNMCIDLVYLGIVPKKSGKEIFPEYAIPNELKRHFIRGFMDGDGWITQCIVDKKYHSLEVGICSSSINILYSIKLFLEKELNIPLYISKREDKYLFDLKAFTRNAEKLLDYLYKDSTIYLIRKKNKYDNVKLGPVNKNV